MFQVYATWPLPPEAIDICALKTIFKVVPQAMVPKLFGFMEIAAPANCTGVLVPFGVSEGVGETLATGVVFDTVDVEEPVCEGTAPHALAFKQMNAKSRSTSNERLSIATPLVQKIAFYIKEDDED